MSVQLGKQIAAARVRAKMSGPQLAERAGVSAGWIRQLETGRMKKPGAEKLQLIARELGLPLEPMLAMTDQLGVVLEAPVPAGEVAALITMQSELLREQIEATRENTAMLARVLAQLTGQPLVESPAQPAIQAQAAAGGHTSPLPQSDPTQGTTGR